MNHILTLIGTLSISATAFANNSIKVCSPEIKSLSITIELGSTPVNGIGLAALSADSSPDLIQDVLATAKTDSGNLTPNKLIQAVDPTDSAVSINQYQLSPTRIFSLLVGKSGISYVQIYNSQNNGVATLTSACQ